MTAIDSSTPEKEIILMSGGVESTTMLHMRNRRFKDVWQNETGGYLERVPKDFLIPLFINYGAD